MKTNVGDCSNSGRLVVCMKTAGGRERGRELDAVRAGSVVEVKLRYWRQQEPKGLKRGVYQRW